MVRAGSIFCRFRVYRASIVRLKPLFFVGRIIIGGKDMDRFVLSADGGGYPLTVVGDPDDDSSKVIIGPGDTLRKHGVLELPIEEPMEDPRGSGNGLGSILKRDGENKATQTIMQAMLEHGVPQTAMEYVGWESSIKE